MNQTEYIKGIKSELLKLDTLDERLEELTSMCAAFATAFIEGGTTLKTYSNGFALFYSLLYDYAAEHAAFAHYMTDTYLHEESIEV